jgi:hypothetical protein
MNPKLRDIITQLPPELRQQIRDLLGDDARVQGMQVDGAVVILRVVRGVRETWEVTLNHNNSVDVETIDEADL